MSHSHECTYDQQGRCDYCPRLNKTGKIKSTSTGKTYTSKINITCKSSNLIYVLTCKRCGLQYVGQTYRRVIDRVGEHFTKIRTAKLDTDMGLHYNSNNHQKLDDVEITVVDFIYSHPKSAYAEKLRNKIEKDWISKLRTQVPFGMNLADAPAFSIQR